ncbi:MAG: hypothetical protein K2N49_03510 [Ruminococcus sp.]|nr:hypothetical protein [Ruminococcus sp.]MDE7225912.1 hypothetical protein [Ruminococcus sp.]
MDIKSKISELADKVKNDKDFSKKFMDNPVKAVEDVLGIDLPDEQVKKIADGIKAKINVDEIGGKLSGIIGKFKK